MSSAEVDVFLGAERTCRLASVGPEGPHATPLWFVWDGSALWISSLVRSRRWTELRRDPRAAVVVDAGEDYFELRGVELTGAVELVGTVPRTGEADPDVADAEARFGAKYFDGGPMIHDGRHGWLRLVPESVVSWDFRKLAGLG